MKAALSLGGAVLGALLGLAARSLAGDATWLAWTIENVARPVGQVFLRLLFMLVVPLVFSALVIGVAQMPLRHLGRVSVRLLGYTVALSAIAVAIGVALVDIVRPGEGMGDLVRASGATVTLPAREAPGAIELLVRIVPDNPVAAAANGDMLALIFFSLVFGIALSLTHTDAARALEVAIAGLYDVMTKLIGGVLVLMPLGVFALVFAMTARLGLELLAQLAGYVGVVLLGLALQQFVVYSISVRVLGGMSPRAFFSGAREAMLVAFSTSSSSATLPTALRVAEERLKLPPEVSRFVLTAGSAMNQNGTALFEGVTVLFLAQLYGVELGALDQVVVVIICILGGIGTAGVPAGSLPVIAMVLEMYAIPREGLGLVLGVDRLLDMCRTVVNVTGDLAAAVYVSNGAEVAKEEVANGAEQERVST